jgi:hypothetical protein
MAARGKDARVVAVIDDKTTVSKAVPPEEPMEISRSAASLWADAA